MDLVAGDSVGVVVYDASEEYGSVGNAEVVGWYDVGFDLGGIGDGVGVWFEEAMSSGGGNWKDWLRVLVLDGEVVLERVVVGDVGGGLKSVRCGLRNAGGGGLRNLQGKLRGLSGVEVVDSMSAYGDLVSGGYGEGDGYEVRELGGVVRYQVKVWDAYSWVWKDTVDVREVGVVGTVGYEVGSDNVELVWGRSGDSMLAGYDIYRGDERGGSYSLVGRAEGYSRYVDGGLASEESYYYYIRARDAMGNLSASSETVEAWTGAPELPGWPAELRGAAFSSPVAGDAMHDGFKEVFVGSKGLEVAGFDRMGTVLAGFPYIGTCEVWSSPALADLDGNGTLECIFGEGKPPYGVQCGMVVALNGDGTFVTPERNPDLPPGSPGWPQIVSGPVRSSPTVLDLDGDGHPEIIVGIETRNEVYVFRSNGEPYLVGSYVFGRTNGGIWATPCVCDLDGDRKPEVIVCDLSGCLYIWRNDGSAYLAEPSGLVDNVGTSFRSSPAAGDIDGDGFSEIVAVGAGGAVFAWNHDGTPVRGEDPLLLRGEASTWASPALADFDSDDALEIVVTIGNELERGKVLLFRGDGSAYGDSTVIFTWDHGMGYSSPLIADTDDDSQFEIVACSVEGNVFVLDADGKYAHGFPQPVDGLIYSSPLIDDLDNDGRMDLVVAGYDARMNTWDLKSPYSPERVPWGMFHHDPWHTGNITSPSCAIAIFRNHVLERALDIFVMAREPIRDTPVIVVSSNSARDTLEVNSVLSDKYIFRAHHISQAASAETMYVTTTDTYGNRGIGYRVITYSRVLGDSLVATSWDGVLTARAPLPSSEVRLAVLPVDTEYLTPGAGQTPGMEAASYNLCFLGGTEATLSIRAHVGSQTRGVSQGNRILYRFEQEWVPVAGQRQEGDCIFVEAASPGIYCLGTDSRQKPDALTIYRLAPNPFREKCSLIVGAPHGVRAEVRVFDVRGRLVRNLYQGATDGPTEVWWDGTDSFSRKVSSGIYFLSARAGSAVATRKIVLAR
jgi:hypothetical protein